MKRYIIIAPLLLTLFSSAQNTKDTINPSDFDQALFEKAVFDRVNAYREYSDVEPLVYNPLLYEAGNDHCNYMYKKKKLTHEQNISGKRTIQDRVKYYAKTYRSVGENVAQTYVLKPTYNYDSKSKTSLNIAYTYEEAVEYLFNAWKQSESHKKNILSKDYELSAIAIRFDPKDYAIYAVQVFARFDK